MCQICLHLGDRKWNVKCLIPDCKLKEIRSQVDPGIQICWCFSRQSCTSSSSFQSCRVMGWRHTHAKQRGKKKVKTVIIKKTDCNLPATKRCLFRNMTLLLKLAKNQTWFAGLVTIFTLMWQLLTAYVKKNWVLRFLIWHHSCAGLHTVCFVEYSALTHWRAERCFLIIYKRMSLTYSLIIVSAAWNGNIWCNLL